MPVLTRVSRPLNDTERELLQKKIAAFPDPSMATSLSIFRRIAIIFFAFGLIPIILGSYGLAAIFGRHFPHWPPRFSDALCFAFAYAVLVGLNSVLSIKDKFDEQRSARHPFEQALQDGLVNEIRIHSVAALALPNSADLHNRNNDPESYDFFVRGSFEQAYLLQTFDSQLVVVSLHEAFLYWPEEFVAKLPDLWPNSDMTRVISGKETVPIRAMLTGTRLSPVPWNERQSNVWPQIPRRDQIVVGHEAPGDLNHLSDYFHAAKFARFVEDDWSED